MANPVRACRECLATRTRREWGVLWSAYLVFWGVLAAFFVIHLEVMTFYLPPGIIAFGPERGETQGHSNWVKPCAVPIDPADHSCNRFSHGNAYTVAKANVKNMQFDSQKQDLALAVIPPAGTATISPTPWIKNDDQNCGADQSTSCLSDYSASQRQGGEPEVIETEHANQQIRLLAQWESRVLAGDVNVECFDSGTDDSEAPTTTTFEKVYSAPIFSDCFDPYMAERRSGEPVADCSAGAGSLNVTWPTNYHAPQIFQYMVRPSIPATATMGAAVRVICATTGPLENEKYAGLNWLRNSDTKAIEVEFEFVWAPTVNQNDGV